MNNMYLIASREYMQRVRKKGFIITTLLMPVFIVLLMVAPALVSDIDSTELPRVTVVDLSGEVGPALSATGKLPYEVKVEDPATFDASKISVNGGVTLVIGEDAVDNHSAFAVYSDGNVPVEVIGIMESDLRNAVEDVRMAAYENDVENLREILEEVSVNDLNISTKKFDNDGNETDTNSIVASIVGIGMGFIMYMFILIYGQVVMHSIIEEKNSRVLELVVTSVKPTHLMLGKILGIGAVAVTQVVIWGLIVLALTQYVMPGLAVGHPALQALLMIYGSLSYVSSIIIYLILFLLGGFILNSTLYAAIGASVDNAQDASQYTTFCVVPIVLSLIFAMTAGGNPDSSMAFWLSIIPLTSPMVMMARIPSGVPGWEIALSLALLVAFICALIWLTAKIYRVGIFMYGKKPTISEILRWVRQK